MTSASGPRAALDISEELVHQAAPNDFRVTLRLHGAEEPVAPLCTALTASSVRADGEAAALRARINKLSKNFAQERKTLESTIRKLKECTKTGSREVFHMLGKLESNVTWLGQRNLYVARQYKYYRNLANTLGKEAKLREAKLQEARADAEIYKRRFHVADSMLGRKEHQLQKSNERRLAVLANHKDQAATIRLAHGEATHALHAAESMRASLREKERELALAQDELDARRDGGASEAGDVDADEHGGMDKDDEAAPSRHEQAESIEASDDECEQLAGITKLLVRELVATRNKVCALETEMAEQAKFEPPAFIEDEAIKSDRSRRRKTQMDNKYLEDLFSHRPWSGQDLARALEKTEQLDRVLDSRQVKRAPVCCWPFKYAFPLPTADLILLLCVCSGLGAPYQMVAR